MAPLLRLLAEREALPAPRAQRKMPGLFPLLEELQNRENVIRIQAGIGSSAEKKAAVLEKMLRKMRTRTDWESETAQLRRESLRHKAKEARDLEVDSMEPIHETHEVGDFSTDPPRNQKWQEGDPIEEKYDEGLKEKYAKPRKRPLSKVYEGGDVTETLKNIERELGGNSGAARKAMGEILEHPEAGKLKAEVVRKLAPKAYQNWEWGINANFREWAHRTDDVGVLARNAAAALSKGNLAAANAFSAAAYTASKGYNFERMEEVAHAYLRGESVHPTTPLNVQKTIDADDMEVQIGKGANEKVPEWKWLQAERKAAVGEEFNDPGSRSAEDVIKAEERSRAFGEEMKAAKSVQARPKAQGGPSRYSPGQGLLPRKIGREIKEDLPLFFQNKRVSAQDVVDLRKDLFPPGRKPSAIGQGFLDAINKLRTGEGALEPGAGRSSKPRIYGKTDWSKKNLADLVERAAKGLKGDPKQTALLKIIEEAARGKPMPIKLGKRTSAILKLLRLL